MSTPKATPIDVEALRAKSWSEDDLAAEEEAHLEELASSNERWREED